MDRNFIFVYLLSIAFVIALLCFGFKSYNLIQWIIILCIGTAINIMCILHGASFNYDKTKQSRET